MASASDGHHRLAYVGISRARVKAHLFTGKDRNYKNFKMRSKDL
jgi:ATP-dependent exoDNAse (exonuclease V) alpha subunit